MKRIIKAVHNFFTDNNGGQCESCDCEKCPFPQCEKKPETEKESGAGRE